MRLDVVARQRHVIMTTKRQGKGMKTLKFDSGAQVTPGSSLITDPARNWRHPQTVARVTTWGKSKNGDDFIFQVRNQ